jgi:4-amino-4-deoxy-L-arabinose transferase-like glycosyltransferase
LEKTNLKANKTFSFLLLVLSLLLAAAGQYFLYFAKATPAGVVLLAGAMAAFIAAYRRFFGTNIAVSGPGQPSVIIKPFDPKEIMAFICIIITACFFRFYLIDSLPPGAHRDEAKAALDSYNISRGIVPEDSSSKLPVYINGITDNPAFYNYMIGFFYSFMPAGITTAREASALIGVLAVAAFYFLARAMLGCRAAIIGGFLFAVSRWHFTFSREVIHAGFSVFAVCLALYFCWIAYKRPSIMHFILAGLTSSICAYSFQAGRAFPLFPALFFIYVFLSEPGYFRRNWRGVVSGASVFIIVLFPLNIYAAAHYSAFLERANYLFLFSRERSSLFSGSGPAILKYLDSLAKSLLMFNERGTGNPVYNFDFAPMLDFASGLFMALGFGFAVYGMLKGSKLQAFLMLFFMVAIQGTALFIEAPYATRGVMTLPSAILFASMGIETALKTAEKYRPSAGKAAIAAAVAVVLLSAMESYHIYFDLFRKGPQTWTAFSADSRKAGEYLQALGPGWTAEVDQKYLKLYESYSFDLATADMPERAIRLTGFDQEYTLLRSGLKPGNNVIILSPDSKMAIPYILAIYPGAAVDTVNEEFNRDRTSFFAIRIPQGTKRADTAGSGRGLNASYRSAYGTRLDRVDPLISFSWDDPPVPFDFYAQWSGILKIRLSGKYRFVMRSNTPGTLEIDGTKVYSGTQIADGAGNIELSSGLHRIIVKAGFTRISTQFSLDYEGPDSPLLGTIPAECFSR